MKSQTGFSLLEVMIAGVMTSMGLAGLAALLLSAVLATSAAEDRTKAAMLIDGLAGQIAVSPSAKTAFQSQPPETVPDCTGGTVCSAADFAMFNFKRWQLDASLALPGGTGGVCLDGTPNDGAPGAMACDGSGPKVIKLFWNDRQSGEIQRLYRVTP